MRIDAASLQSAQVIAADVCILGGGVAAIALANELLAHCGKIVILESGGDAFEEDAQSFNAVEGFPKVYADPMYSRLRSLGGSSNHWLNNTSPFDPIDFEAREWIPNSGWPISFDEVNRYYPKAGVYCGVGDDGYDSRQWLERAGLRSPLNNSAVVRPKIAKAASPPTRFFQKHGGVLAASKRVTILSHANVVELEFDAGTQHVNRAIFTATGILRHSVVAPVFVMCMGGIENARMLLHFNNKYNQQLGNRHGNVGRYFMDHPSMDPATVLTPSQGLAQHLRADFGNRFAGVFFDQTEAALRSRRITNSRISFFDMSNYDLSDGISSFHILKEKLAKGQVPDELLKHMGNLLFDLDMVAEAISRKSFNKKLFEHAEDFAGLSVSVMMEQTPEYSNRVRLGQTVDRLGIPRAVIDWSLSASDIEMMWQGLFSLGVELGKLSLGRIRLLKERSDRLFGDQMGFGNHHMGTTRMALSDKTGVVDRNSRVFGTNNLYIAGSSVFPTGSHVPPTLTIVALTIRLAEFLRLKGCR